MAIEGRPSDWVADHRRHHAYADIEGDPHSPHVGHGHEGPGFWNAVRGAWHAHIGWFLARRKDAGLALCAGPAEGPRGDVDRPPVPVVHPAGAGRSPGALGFALTGGSWIGALTGAFWGGAVRIFVTHHVTWSVNSICHMFGRRPFVDWRPEHEQLGAGAADAWRGLAPQPPRVPDQRLSWAASLAEGDGSFGVGRSGVWRRRGWLGMCGGSSEAQMAAKAVVEASFGVGLMGRVG